MSQRLSPGVSFEPLETRKLLATVHWDGGPDGTGSDFFAAVNWEDDVLPAAGDTAVIGDTGSAGAIRLGGSTSVAEIQTSRSLDIVSGAVLVGTRLLGSDGAIVGFSSTPGEFRGVPTLTAVHTNMDIDLGTTSFEVRVSGGLTLDAASIRLGNAQGSTSSRLTFLGGQTLGGTGSVFFGGSSSNSIVATRDSAEGGVLTIGPGIAIRGQSGVITSDSAQPLGIVNEGSIVADAAVPSVTDAGYDFGFSDNSYATTIGSIDRSGVADPLPESVYSSVRFRIGNDFSYTIDDLTPGQAYRVRLHFASDTYQFQQSVRINGLPVLTNFDALAAAGGPRRAVVREFDAVATAAGSIVATFSGYVSAIELLSGAERVLVIDAGGRLPGSLTVSPSSFENRGIIGVANRQNLAIAPSQAGWANTGTIAARSGSLAAGPLTETSGDVVIGQDGVLTVAGDYRQTGGTTRLAGGTLDPTGGVVVDGGTLIGSGRIAASVTNAGSLLPGGSEAIGELHVEGGYVQTATGVLGVEIAGPPMSVSFNDPAVAAISAEAEPNGGIATANDLRGSFTAVGPNQFRAVVTGNISSGDNGDWDYYRIRVRPGDRLRIDLEGGPTNAGTLPDSYLYLYRADGSYVAADDDSGAGTNSLITLVDPAAMETDYYVVADSFGSGTGTYRLTVTVTGPEIPPTVDRLVITGAATLAGSLEVAMAGGYHLTESGVAFGVLAAASVTGGFAATAGLEPSAGRAFAVNYEPAAVSLVSSVTGDAGPLVTAVTPAGLVNQAAVTLRVTFDRPLDGASFTAEDVTVTGPNGVVAAEFVVTQVTDTEFEIPLSDLADGDYTVAIGPDVTDGAGHAMPAAATAEFTVDTSGPQIISAVATDGITTPLRSFEVTFDGPIDPASFTTADVQLTGPALSGGSVASVTQISPTTYRVALSIWAQAPGSYTLAIGPDIRDLAGNRLDQDQDGTAGEVGDDVFTVDAEVGRVDLVVSEVTILTASPTAGAPVEVAWTVRNDGDTTAVGGWYDTISVTSVASNSFVASSGFFNALPIPPGESLTLTTSVWLPDGQQGAGELRFTVTADGYGYLAEWQGESNNTATVTATSALPSYPDLVVRDLRLAEAALVAGGTMTIQWSDFNQGQAATNNRYWYDTIRVVDLSTNRTLLDTSVYESRDIPVNGSVANQYAFTLPADFNPATAELRVTVTADGFNYLPESQENGDGNANNAAEILWSGVSDAPDLVVRQLSVVQAELVAGGTVTVRWNDVNQGGSSTQTGWRDRLLVVNATTGETILDREIEAGEPLSANGILPRESSFTLPAGAAGTGTIEITVTADSGGEITEVGGGGTAETNNTATLTRTAVTKQLIDVPAARMDAVVGGRRSDGLIDVGGDVDAFMIDLAAGQRLTVSLAPVAADLRLRLEILDAEGTVIAERDAAFAGERVTLAAQVTAAGEHLVRVTGLAGSGGYELFTSVNAAIEGELIGGGGNDAVGSAESLVGTAIPLVGPADRLAVFGTADGSLADHYAFTLVAGQEATLVATASAAVNDPTVELLDASGNLLALGVAGATNSGPAIRGFVAASAGTYLARVRGPGGAGYSLVVLRGAGLESEPNDSLAAATPLGPSGLMVGRIAAGAGGGSGSSEPGTAVSLPRNLTDGTGFLWDVQSDGNINDGTSDAYDGGLRLSGFPGYSTATATAGGREIAIGPATVSGGLQVSRRIYVPADQGWARFLEVVTNPGPTAASYTVSLSTNLGSDGATSLIGTSSGNAAFGPADDWIVTDDGIGGDPTMLHVIAGPGAAVRPTQASRSGDSVNYAYSLSLAPGETRIVMHFASQNVDQPTALAKGPALTALPAEALQGLSTADLAAIVNFAIRDADSYSLQALAGVPLSIETATAPDSPADTLAPTLELLDPSGAVVATNTGGAADGRNARITHTPTASGVYRVRVTGGATMGPYLLSVTGAGQFTGPAVTSVTPAVGRPVSQPPAALVFTFDQPLLATSVQASDLLLAGSGGTVTAATLVDGRTVRFDLAFTETTGTVEYSLAAGVANGLAGNASVAFSGNFRFDTVGPRVVAVTPSSPVTPSWNQATFTFDEPLDPATVGVSAVAGFTGPSGADLRGSISGVSLGADGTQLTVQFFSLSPARTGIHTLTLADSIRDLAGNRLDQDGDGTAAAYAATFELQGPDLRVTDLTVSPTTLRSGDAVTIRWVDANFGQLAASGGFYDRLRIRNTTTDETLLETDLWQGQSIAAGSTLAREYTFTLPDGDRGTGEISFTVTADYFGGIAEASADGTAESNNSATLTRASTLNAYADLLVATVTPPATGRFGDAMELSYRVENSGQIATTTGWQDAFYLSADDVLDGSDRLLAVLPTSGSYGPLAVGEGVTRSVTLQLPLVSTLDAGSYRVIVVTNSGEQQVEVNRGNNTRASDAFPVTLPPVADLVVAEITAPAQGFAGQAVEVSWTVRNDGAAAVVGTLTDAIWLVDAGGSGSDVWLGSFAAAVSIPAGGSITRTQSVTLPTGLSGPWRFVVATDVANAFFEHAGEANNTATDDATILVQLPPVPNLRVASVTVPPSGGFSSSPVLVSWTVTNAGTGATNAPLWTDAVYLSTDDVLDADDVRLGSQANPAYLAPGESYSSSLTVTLPRGISGSYRIIVAADEGNAVFENTAEGDNTRSASLDVTLLPPPDLRVTNVAAPAQAFSGSGMTVNWTVSNAGSGQTLETAWVDAVYLSSDTTLDGADIPLGTFARSGRLPAGESYTATGLVTLPVGVAGDFFVLVRTDAFDAVYEHTSEGNNVGFDATPVTVLLNPPPDLEVTSVSSPGTGIANQPLEVSYTVANVGAMATPENAWLDELFLSADDSFDPATDQLLASRWRYGSLLADPDDPARSGYSATFTATLPPTLSGNYRLFVVTDRARRVFELDRANNVRLSATPLVVSFLPPDLVADSLAAPATGAAGGSVVVSYRVQNVGTGPTNAAAWTDRIVLSTDQVRGNADDILLADIARSGGLAAAASYTVTDAVVPIPLTVPAGGYFLFAVADATNQVYEHTAETNNASQPVPITVSRSTADLRVTAVTAGSASVTAGGSLSVSWTVANQGSAATDANWWNDGVYLSLDGNLGDANDVLLGTVQRNDPLAAAGSYSVTRAFTVPAGLAAGSYRVLVATDISANVFEGAAEGNNMLAAAGTVSVAAQPRPNLVVTGVTAPTTGLAGQSLAVSWTQRNSGAAAATGRWYDAVYLSLDQALDGTDRFLGFVERSGPLASGAETAVSGTVRVPQGVAGSFYVFVVADAGGALTESVETDNAAFAATPVTLTLPPPADLVLGTISVPMTAVSGSPLSLTYTVRNEGVNTATGSWTDAVFLSTDDFWDTGDLPLGQVSVSETVAAGGQYSRTLSTTAPAVTPGDYRVIVRTDIRNVLPEADEANNLAASLDSITFDVPTLPLGEDVTGSLSQGGAIAYKFVLPTDGETVRISFDSAANDGDTALFVRFGSMPTAAAYDLASTNPFQADQTLVVPADSAGTYYLLVQRRQGSGGFTLRAEIVPFSVSAVAPTAVGNGGEATVRIAGARFGGGTVFRLVAAGGTEIDAVRTLVADSATAYVTFDLAEVPVGSYTLRAEDGSQQASLPFVVRAGTGGDVVTQLEGPLSVRPNTTYGLRILYGNEGDRDLGAPLLLLRAPSEVRLGGSAADLAEGGILQVLATSPDGPAGTLRPGGPGGANVSFRTADADVTVDMSVRAVTAADTTAIRDADWVELERSARPAGLTDSAWATFWGGFRAAVGVTWGDYVQSLGRMAAAIGGRPQDVRALFAAVQASFPGFDPTLGVAGTPPAPRTGPLLPALPPGPAFGTWRELDRGTNSYVGRYRPQVIVPIDPNDIVNPPGFGAEQWIRGDQKIPYMIRFENAAEATAPAQVVRITQTLDPDLNPNSFRLGGFAFDNLSFTVPDNVAFYSTRLDLTAARGYFVDVAAGIDVATREAFWTFTTIDPATGEQPLDATVGFLPVNDDTGRGDGHVSYTVRPRSSAVTGARLDAGLDAEGNDYRAAIVFDTEAPILTPSVFNTLDADLPTSAVVPLPERVDASTFTVAWGGSDAGSGLAAFTVYVSVNGGAFSPWLENTTARSAEYVGAEGRTYAFYSVAADNVGNVEAAPAVADTTTRTPGDILPPGQPTVVVGTPGNAEVSLSWTAPASVGSGPITDYVVQYKTTAAATWTVFADGVSAGTTATVTGLANGTSYLFRVAAVNFAGSGEASAASAAVRPRTVPAAPGSLSGQAGDGQVSLSWAAPVTTGGAAVSDYVVEYKAVAASAWTTFADGVSTNRSVTVTGLSNGTSYVFRVAAVNEAGAGMPSPVSSPVTPVAVPEAPTNLVATAERGRATVSWMPPSSDGGTPITGYVIRWGVSGLSSSTYAPATATSVAIAGLVDGLTYQFDVSAFNAVGTGSPSDPAVVTVPREPGFPVRGGGAEDDYARSLVTVGGATIVTGSFSGQARFGGTTLTSAGSSDIFVARLNADGSYAWAVRAGGADGDEAVQIAALADGSTFVVGSAAGPATFGGATLAGAGGYIAKLGPSGSFVWVRPVGGSPSGVATLADGSAVVTGSFSGSATFGDTTLSSTGQTDVFVARVAADGSYGWVARAGGYVESQPPGWWDPSDPFGPGGPGGYPPQPSYAEVRATAIATLADGSVYVAGDFNFQVDFFGGGLLGDPMGGIGQQMFLAKLNPGGSPAWVRELRQSLSGPTSGIADLATLADGSVLAVGSFEYSSLTVGETTLSGGSGGGEAFVARFSAAGEVAWAVRAGGEFGSDSITGIAARPDGSAILTGSFSWGATFGGSEPPPSTYPGYPYPGYPGWYGGTGVVEIDPQGNFGWPAASTGAAHSAGIGLLPDGSAVVGGSFGSAVVFGEVGVSTAGGSDVFVARILPGGSYDLLPSEPLAVFGTPGNALVSLTWASPSRQGAAEITDYRVEYSSDGGSTWTTYADGVSTATAATVTGLANGTSYMFRVSALSSAGAGRPSAVSAAYAPSLVRPSGWPQQAGGTGSDRPRAIATFGDGSAVVTGFFAGTATFGGTTLTAAAGQSPFVARLDADGAIAWVREVGGSAVVAVDEWTALAAGTTTVVWPETFSPSGWYTPAWPTEHLVITRLADDGSQSVHAMAGATPASATMFSSMPFVRASAMAGLGDGAVLVAGAFTGEAQFPGATTLYATDSTGSSATFFLAKLGADGLFDWAIPVGDAPWAADPQTVHETLRVAALADGSAILTGEFTGSITFGDTTLTAPGDSAGFVVRFAADGTLLWAEQITASDVGSPGFARIAAVAGLADGRLVVAGSYAGVLSVAGVTNESGGFGGDAFVAMLDAAGGLVWVAFGESGFSAGGSEVGPTAVTPLADGSVLVAGSFEGTAVFGDTTLSSAGAQDMFVARFAADGSHAWARKAGGTGADAGVGLATLAGGAALVTGSFAGPITFGETTLTARGGTDIFVARIAPDGSFAEAPEPVSPVRVTGVYVRGSGWVAGYLARTPFTTLDGAALGWQLPDGEAQLTGAASVSWSNVDVISVRFDQPISQPAADAMRLVLGTAGGSQTIVPTAAPTLLAGGTVVQWTLPAALATGRYAISIAAAGITNAAGTATLDGEWTTSTSTFSAGSGDGVAGGTFNFFFNVLVGNVNGDTVINAGDISAIRNKLTSPLNTPLAADADFRLDVDGSNTLTAADISRIRRELTGPLGTSLSSLPQVTAPAESTPGSSGAFAALADQGGTTSTGKVSSGLSAEAWAWYAIESGLEDRGEDG